MFKPMIAWADAKSGFAVSFLAPNGCAWRQTPAHDCTLTTEDDPDLNAENAVALAAALEAVLKAYDVRLDGFRYYGASGGSIFLTDEWLPLQGGKYPGALAPMCGGEVATRAYAWDKQDMTARAQNPQIIELRRVWRPHGVRRHEAGAEGVPAVARRLCCVRSSPT